MKRTKFLTAFAPLALVTLLAVPACKFEPNGDADTYKLDVNIDTRGVTISMWTGFGSSITSTLENIINNNQILC